MDTMTCLVCTVSITAAHLGSEVCRACAGFFKRTQLAGRKFACRQGTSNCVITSRKRDKFMCRRCRYDKCVAIGMAYVLSGSKKYSRRECKPILKVKNVPSIVTVDSGSISPNISLLDLMEAEYKASCERRLDLEKAYVIKCKLHPFHHDTEEFYVGNFAAFYEAFRIAMKDSVSLIKKVFVEFDSLPMKYRISLFQNFFRKFNILENVYRSAKHFYSTSTQAVSMIICADASNDSWLEDDKLVKTDAFRSSVRGFAKAYDELLSPMRKMSELTEREFYGLAVLAYCDVDTSLLLPDKIIENAAETRGRIFSELQDYYRNELNLHDFSKRLGTLMTLAHGAGEAGVLMNEEMKMYSTMFDLHTADQFILELFPE